MAGYLWTILLSQLAPTPPSGQVLKVVTMFVAIIDRSWFDLLSGAQPDVANFWQPIAPSCVRVVAVITCPSRK